MSKKIKPWGQRVLVKEAKEDKYVENAAGIILEKEETTRKNRFSRVEIVSIGTKCEDLTENNIGDVVLIHEFAGAELVGIDSKLRIIHETDIQGYEED